MNSRRIRKLNNVCPFCHTQIDKDTPLLRIYKCGTIGGWFDGLYDPKCSAKEIQNDRLEKSNQNNS